MEKRIKSFTQFFESVSSGITAHDEMGTYIHSIFIESEEDYGYPTFVLKDAGDLFRTDGSLVNPPDIDDLFDEYMDSPNGPINGIDGFGDLVSSVEEYLGDESEENLESIDSWLDSLGLRGTDPKKLADSYAGDITYWNETSNKFNLLMNKNFMSTYFEKFEGKSWNFLILSAEGESTGEKYSGTIEYESPCFGDFFSNCPFNLCYNDDSENLYVWKKSGENYEFIDTGLKKEDLSLSVLDLVIKLLYSKKVDKMMLSKNFIKPIEKSGASLYKEIMYRLQKDGRTDIINFLKGASTLQRFGLTDED